MAADPARDDLARLAIETQNLDTLATAFDHLAKAIPDRVTRGVLERATETLRAKLTGLRDRMSALLALATEALDRREGLVFGPPNKAGTRVARAVDGVLYHVSRSRSQRGTWLWMTSSRAKTDGTAVGFCATEAEAIDAAREHDRKRRDSTNRSG